MPFSIISPKRILGKKSDMNISPPSSPLALSQGDPTLTSRLELPKLNTKNIASNSEVSSYYETPNSSNFNYRSNFVKFDNASIQSNTHKRTLSDKVKTTPSSLVRQSIVYSSSYDEHSDPSLNSIKGKSLLLQNRIVTETLPPELSPIVTLINSQKLRTYALGKFQIPGMVEANGEKIWLEVEAKLTGNELAIWRPSNDDYLIENGNDEFKPKYINLIDSKIELTNDNEIQIYQDFKNDNILLIKFHSDKDYIMWITAIQLSNFEYISLNEAFTAVTLSIKGPKLSDIHILLSSKKRFPKFEWCNLRLPQISSKWIKVYLAIIPSDSKKTGRIEIYLNDRISKKNLILYIPRVLNIFNVYPEQSNMIDLNSIMKLNGEIYINKNYEHVFYHNDNSISTPTRSLSIRSHSRTTSSTSLSSMSNSQQISNSKKQPATSTSSFFNNASSPAPELKDSPKKTLSFIKKNLDHFVVTNYLYLMPVGHPGVSPIETMIRNFIHIIDSFKLYGRPNQLISDKTNKESLLYGLPSLPHYQYLSMEDSMELVSKNIQPAMSERWDEFNWRNLFKTFISNKLSKGSYKGHGDITKLYSNLDINYEEISSPSISLPAHNDSPIQPGYEFDNFSDSIVSPPISENDLITDSLGYPIELRERNKDATDSLDDFKFDNAVNGNPNYKSLEPIIDMPTPIDEIHPYSNLISLKINDDEIKEVKVNYG